MRHFLPKILGLWASAFPPTPDEAETEKNKGDPYTWQVTLECRSGALAGIGLVLFTGGVCFCYNVVHKDSSKEFIK